MLAKLEKYRFLFEELVKRDFKKKYKRTVLGMLWSILSPLLTLCIMALVFTRFFGNTTEHYVIYLFCGNLLFNYFSEATSGGMRSLMSNSSIFTKVDVPKYMFLFSSNVQSFINFSLTLIIFFIFVAFEPGLTFGWNYLLLIFPIVCLTIFNIGIGMILSALFIFFRDIEYLYSVFTMLLLYLSAVFYNINAFALQIQYLFYLNPIYVFIRYFRKIVIENDVPQFSFHLLCLFYALLAFGIGSWMYKKFNHKFLYYV